jgi:hypothetical protein
MSARVWVSPMTPLNITRLIVTEHRAQNKIMFLYQAEQLTVLTFTQQVRLRSEQLFTAQVSPPFAATWIREAVCLLLPVFLQFLCTSCTL